MPGNGDLKIKLDPQNSRKAERRQIDHPSDGVDAGRAGYSVLDRASTDEYSGKERKGLAENANYPRRYC